MKDDMEELRALLAEIAADEERLKKAEQDLGHAELCISSAKTRLEIARAKALNLIAGDADTIEFMARLAKHAEQYGRTHQ